MAEGKNTVVVYRDWADIFNALSDENAGLLIKHFFAYISDKNPEPPNNEVKLAFILIQSALKRDLKKWERYIEKQSENGKRGGRPRKENQQSKEVFNTEIKHDLFPGQRYTIDELFESLKNGDAINVIFKGTDISVDYAKKLIPEFRKKCKTAYRDYDDFTSHFKFWVGKQALFEENKKQNNPTKSRGRALDRD